MHESGHTNGKASRLVLAFVGVAALLWPVGATAQSAPEPEELARIARELQESRTGSPRATRVFTNDNIRRVGRPLAAASGMIAPNGALPAAEADVGQASGGASRAGGRTEAEWREAFAAAHEEIERAEDRLTLAEQELQTLDRRLLTESSLYNREGQLGPMITAKREEIAQAEVRVRQAHAALAALQTELRTAGGPPGWAR